MNLPEHPAMLSHRLGAVHGSVASLQMQWQIQGLADGASLQGGDERNSS